MALAATSTSTGNGKWSFYFDENGVNGGGTSISGSLCISFTENPPVLSVSKSHSGSFAQGGSGTYDVKVGNTGPGPTGGLVTVTDNTPSGMTVTGMSGTGWDCSTLPSCTRSDSLSNGSNYPDITVNVSIAGDASYGTNALTNSVQVSGGGAAAAVNATDPTSILAGTAVSVSSSENPSTYGDSISFTATVTAPHATPNPTDGTVQFYVDGDASSGTALGSPVNLDSNGQAQSPTTSSLNVPGSPHTITAVYTADETAYHGSTGTLSGGQGVNQAPLTVTADDSSMTYGGTVPTIDYQITGFVKNQDSSILTGAPYCTTDATSSSGANGAYVTSCTQGTLTDASGNYSFSFLPGTFTVNQAPLTVTAQDQIISYPDDYDHNLDGTSATAITLQSSDTLSSLNGSITSTYIPGSSDAGSYPLAPSINDANYNPSYNDGTLTVNASSGSTDLSCPTYAQLATAITDYSTITIECSTPDDINFSTNATPTAGGGTITISHDVTLDASASTAPITFDGNGDTQIFVVNNGVNFGIKGLSLSNGTLTGNGGAVQNNGGTVTILDSTFSNNTANWTNSNQFHSGKGGALFNVGSMTVSNSTFVGNHGGNFGGAIQNGETANNTGQLTVTNSTFTGNTAFNNYGRAVFELGNSSVTLAADIFADGSGDCQISGGNTDNGYNLSDDGGCLNGGTGDITGEDPILDSNGLQSNGGPTQTVALESGSPAFDAIPSSSGLCTATDQRGLSRPGDTSSNNPNGNCDIGAFEAQHPLSFTVTNSMTYGGSLPTLNGLSATDSSVAFSGDWNGDTVNNVSGATTGCTTTATSNSNAGSYPIAGCSGFSASGHDISLGVSTLTINRAPLTITAGSYTMPRGSSVPTIGYTPTGFVNGDDSSVISGTPTCTTTATSKSAAGTYPTKCDVSGLSAANYTFTAVGGTLTVLGDSLTYTGPPTFTSGSSPTLSATLIDAATKAGISGKILTLTLAPNSSSPESCQTSSTDSTGSASCSLSNVSIPTGKHTLQVSFAGDSSYPASTIYSTVTIPGVKLSYTGPTIIARGSSPTLSATLVDSLNNAPISGKKLTLTLAPNSGSAESCQTSDTDNTGSASCTLNNVSIPSGRHLVSMVFGAGDPYYSANTVGVTVTTPGPDVLTYTGPFTITRGSTPTLTATLIDSSTGAGISGRSLKMTLAPAGSAEFCTGITDNTGTASLLPQQCHRSGQVTT